MSTKQQTDDDEVLRDGQRLRVPLYLMDGDGFDDVQRGIARNAVRVVDHAGNPAGRRPGFLFAADGAGEKDRAAARDAYIDLIVNAWRGPSEPNPVVAVDHREAGARNDDARAEYIRHVTDAWRGGR